MPEDWQRRFAPAVKLPDGRQLKTLDDARQYLMAFSVPRDHPEAKQLLGNALRTVLNAAAGKDVMMHAQIAVGRWARRPHRQ